MKFNTIIFRSVLLAMLFVLLNTWLSVNTGRGLQQYAFVNFTILTFAAAGGLIKRYSGKVEENFESKITYVLTFILQIPVLVILWSLFILSALFVSSVTLESRLGAADCEAKLMSIAPGRRTKAINECNAPVTVLVNPFGRPFDLEAKGYQTRRIYVYPLRPARINIEKDLTISPTVILRMGEYYMSMKNVLKIKIDYLKQTIYDDSIGSNWTFILGLDRHIPPEFLDRWLFSLRAREDLITEKEIYQSLNRWMMDTLFIHANVIPLDTLDIQLIHKFSDKIVMEKKYILGFDIFQDILIN